MVEKNLKTKCKYALQVLLKSTQFNELKHTTLKIKPHGDKASTILSILQSLNEGSASDTFTMYKPQTNILYPLALTLQTFRQMGNQVISTNESAIKKMTIFIYSSILQIGFTQACPETYFEYTSTHSSKSKMKLSLIQKKNQ